MAAITSSRVLVVMAIVMCTVQSSHLYPTPSKPTNVNVLKCPAVCQHVQHESGKNNLTSTNSTLSMLYARVSLEGPDFEFQFFDIALSLVSPKARARLRSLKDVVNGEDIVWEDVLEDNKRKFIGPPCMHALFEVTNLLKVYVNQSHEMNLTTDLYTLWWLAHAVYTEKYSRMEEARNGRIQVTVFAWGQTREVIGGMLNSHCNVVCKRQYVVDQFSVPYGSI